ncbi:lateral tail fiber protein [Escherichia phage IrisVonRoten]|uniref:Lateral tail fiber protein n=1 Tax=Escherichia phage IrisVonRoten TaxID=2852004 RepID=A0AAE8B0H4_9CAUD|nr:lateral tail fiber protein [Escherichia phage IrisVonRoten]
MAITTKIIVQQILNIDDTKATASKFPRYTVTLGNSISSITANELVSSIEAAAKSAAAAKDSEIAAKTSELNAKNSEQEAAISAGASEASATQSATSATQSAASADKSAESAAAAKVSETNSKTSEADAKTSETNAKTSETNAKSSETKAKASETNAKASETNAAASAAAAKLSETNAKVSETNAAASAADSSGFRNEAETFSTQAATSASAAKTSETKAKTSETNAKTSETKAKASETNAASSATSASQSVTTIQGLKSDVEQLKSDTQAIKNSAVTETTAIKADVAQLKTDTQGIKNSAVTETTALKNQAATSATNAASSATEAGKQATNAANSAKTAKTEADRSKTEADRSEAAANSTPDIQPLPDVWIPFNDSLDMLAGFAPGYKQITVGDDVIKMPSDKVVDFKRASGATYINKSGVLTVAEINEPRFERDGLLIEGQRTNYHLNSLTPSKWGATTSVTITESGVDEFGFTYGRFQIKDEKIGTNTTMNIAAIPGGRGVDVTGTEKYVTTSCRVKSDSANIQCRIRFERYDGSAYFYLADAYLNITDMSIRKTGEGAARITARAEKESNGWIYFEVTYQSEAIDNMVGSQIQIAPPVSPGTYSGGEYLQVATPQFEGGACASSFIITEATPVTRASDMVTLPIKNNLYNLPFTVLVEAHKNWSITPNAAPRVFDTSGHQTGAAIILAFGSAEGDNDGFPYCDIGKSNRRVYENAKLKKMIMGMRVKSDYNNCCVSNARISSETKTEWRYIQSTATIRIGGQTNTGERHLFGHIRNFRIWHKELTDRQMKEYV